MRNKVAAYVKALLDNEYTTLSIFYVRKLIIMDIGFNPLPYGVSMLVNLETLDSLKTIANGDDVFISKLVKSFEQSIRTTLDDIDQLNNTQKIDYKNLFHKIKGIAANVGAQAMYEKSDEFQTKSALDSFTWQTEKTSYCELFESSLTEIKKYMLK